MGYTIVALMAIAALLGGLYFSKNFAFSARSNDVLPSVHRLSEVKTKVVPVPEIIQRVNPTYQTLKWTYSEDDFITGMFIPIIYPIYAYEARLDGITSVRVEFCKAGHADVKKIVGSRVSEEPIWPQYADTYVFKLIRNGSIVESWAYKELDADGQKKYMVVEENQLPVIKALYYKVRELTPQPSKSKV